jgi:hypothetical protein
MSLLRQAALIVGLGASLALAGCTEENPAVPFDGAPADGFTARDGAVDAPRTGDGAPAVDAAGDGIVDGRVDDAAATDATPGDGPPADGSLDAAMADAPGVDGPVADGPVADGPVADGPVADGPVVDGPSPDSWLPDYTVPDYTVPDYAAPDFTMPDFTVPDGPLGDALAPACDELSAEYADVLKKAKHCTTLRGCSETVDDELECPCSTFVDPSNRMALVQLAALRATWEAWECDKLFPCQVDDCVEPSAGTCRREGGTGPGICQDLFIQPI